MFSTASLVSTMMPQRTSESSRSIQSGPISVPYRLPRASPTPHSPSSDLYSNRDPSTAVLFLRGFSPAVELRFPPRIEDFPNHWSMVSFDSRWESNRQFYIGVFGSRDELLDSETVRRGRSVVFEIYNRKSKSCSPRTSIAVVEYNLLVAPITTVSSLSLVRSVFVGVIDIGVQVIN